MDEVALDLDPAMVDNMRREADDHEFDDLDEYVQWLLERRDTVLNEYDVWENPPGAVADPDADLAQSSSDTLSVESDTADGPSIDPALDPDAGADTEPDEESDPEEDADLPDEDGADDDDVAAALEDLDLEE